MTSPDLRKAGLIIGIRLCEFVASKKYTDRLSMIESTLHDGAYTM